jgi:hypothetical protein
MGRAKQYRENASVAEKSAARTDDPKAKRQNAVVVEVAARKTSPCADSAISDGSQPYFIDLKYS